MYFIPSKLVKSLITLILLISVTLSGCQNNETPSAGNGNVGEGENTAQAVEKNPPQENPNASEDTDLITDNSNKSMNLPRLTGNATVVMQINGQSVTIEVDGNNAPITAGNFVDLVQQGVYNGSMFHRVVKDPSPFVVQGGDPQSLNPSFPASRLGTGSYIDPTSKTPRYIPLEIRPEYEETKENPEIPEIIYSKTLSSPPELKHDYGVIAMARSQMPDSASSQFYFTLAELPFLDGNYAVFGRVTEGMDVIENIKQGDRITSAEVIAGGENLKK